MMSENLYDEVWISQHIQDCQDIQNVRQVPSLDSPSWDVDNDVKTWNIMGNMGLGKQPYLMYLQYS